MSPHLEEGLIKAVFGIAASVGTYILKKLYDERFLGTVRGSRRNVLGEWEGTIAQESGPSGVPVELPIRIVFTAGRKRIVGRAEYEMPGTRPTRLRFTGGFLYDQLMRLNYKNLDPNVIQFGSYIARLNAGGDKLEGQYSGWGAVTDRIVSGTAVLTKVTRPSHEGSQ